MKGKTNYFCFICGIKLCNCCVSDNDFILACSSHKPAAQSTFELFSKVFPNYTEWHKIEMDFKKLYLLNKIVTKQNEKI
jgi:hypothetical protein